jgi:hypothetical protein
LKCSKNGMWKWPPKRPYDCKRGLFLWDQVPGHELNCHPTRGKPHISRIVKERSSSAIVLVLLHWVNLQSESVPNENTWVLKPKGVHETPTIPLPMSLTWGCPWLVRSSWYVRKTSTKNKKKTHQNVMTTQKNKNNAINCRNKDIDH